ncbi:MAG: glycerol kinase GlpK [Alphaproteobacteria bacterium]
MADNPYLLAIDQGTTSSRAILFDHELQPVASAQKELRQIYPQSGWVEHDAEEIFADTVAVCRQAIAAARAKVPGLHIAAAGITNQRETAVVWDRATGKPLHNAIVWQDRRTAEACRSLAVGEGAALFQTRTGLILDSYFSGTKFAWILDHVEGAREAARDGRLACGTIDSWLIWRLTGGTAHLTDATNAGRTLLFDITRQQWDPELAERIGVPLAMLPEVRDCADDFGVANEGILGEAIPIGGVAGDQHAALIGQCCFRPGMIKSTYGTGCFALVNTGDRPLASRNRLLSTLGYRLAGQPTYALEGSIFIAGAAIQWLRDGLKLFAQASETRALAEAAKPDSAVMFVPAFTGLGAPHWDPDARGAIYGLTRDTGIPEIVRAALESVAFQTRDLLEAMRGDGAAPTTLRVDGGMTANDWAMQALADLLGMPVERPTNLESTAVGAAMLAGLQHGLFDDLDSLAAHWARDRRFDPALSTAQAAGRYRLWREAIARTRRDAVSVD